MFSNVSFTCIPSKYEGFPNVILESLVRNVPVIGNKKCPGVNSLIKNGVNGFLYSSLKDILQNIMSNPNIIYDLKLSCYNSIQEYDIEKVNEMWLEFVRKVNGT